MQTPTASFFAGGHTAVRLLAPTRCLPLDRNLTSCYPYEQGPNMARAWCVAIVKKKMNSCMVSNLGKLDRQH